MSNNTQIQNFFAGKSVFLTGGTGFLGSLLIQKLLSSCPDIADVYVLIREKRNVGSEKRLGELLNLPIFEQLKKSNPNQLKKVILVQGSFDDEGLGLSENDWNRIVESVNCIFHVGASVKFTDYLRHALRANVFGTKQVTLLAKAVKNLECFIHVSTAYSQCTKTVVEEMVYESAMNSEQMLSLADTLGDKLDEIESTFVGKFPNTYTYTKFLAEDYLRRTASDMPVGIVRPTIVCQTWKDPIPGWADSQHSVSQLISCYAIGALHVLPMKPAAVLDMIPAEHVINNIIAAAWDVGTSRDASKEGDIQVFHCGSSHQNPITGDEFARLSNKYIDEYPPNHQIWSRFIVVTSNDVIDFLLYCMHIPQMILFQIASYLFGKPRKYLHSYKKMHSRVGVVTFFLNNSWLFKTDKTNALWNKLEQRDRDLFSFDITSIDWNSAIHNFILGMRKYTLDEDPNTIPRAQFKKSMMKILHYLTAAGGVFLLFIVFLVIFNLVYLVLGL